MVAACNVREHRFDDAIYVSRDKRVGVKLECDRLNSTFMCVAHDRACYNLAVVV